MIKEDKFLIIVTKGGALEQAVKQDKQNFSEEWTSAEGSSAKVLVKDDLTKKQIAEQLTEMWIEFNDRANKDELFAVLEEAIAKQSEWTSDEGNAEDLNTMTVEQIVAKLEEKWLVEWTDFTKDAEKEALIALLLA